MCLLASRSRLGAKPQGGVLGLHCSAYYPHQVVAEDVQVRLFAQPGVEGCQRLCCIILAAVEAPIYEKLDTSPQRVNRAAIARVEATMASCGSSSWPVNACKTAWVAVTPPTYTSARMPVSEA